MFLPEAERDVRLFGPEQISDGEGGETQKAPLTERERNKELCYGTLTTGQFSLFLAHSLPGH